MAEIRQDLVQAAIAGQTLGGPVDIPQAVGVRTSAVPAEGVNQELVQRAVNMAPDEVTLQQRAMLGLIKEDPKLQQQFLERQGFESRIQNGEVQIRDRGGQFVGYNPEGTDIGDFIEYLPEAVEGVVGAVATGAKITGAVAGAIGGSVLPGAGTAAGGAAGLAAGAGLGAAATAGAETAKQTLAKGLGLREELDPGRIARQGAIGAAVPPIVAGAGKALKAGAQGLSRAIFGGTEEALQKDPAAIKEAFKVVGGKPTPGQLSDSPAVQATEEVLAKNRLGLGGALIRKQRRVNEAEAIRTAQDMVAVKSGRAADDFEAGKQFGEQVMSSINKRLEKAENLYGELDQSLKRVPAQTRGLVNGLQKLESDLRFSDDGLAVLNKFRNKLGQIETAEDLKLFRSSINAEIPPTASKNMRIAADRIYALATKARTASYDAAIRELKRIGEPGAEKGLQGLKKKLAEADGIYSDTARKVEQTLLGAGKKLKTGVKRGAREAIEKVAPEKRAKLFLTGQNPEAAAVLKELSPEGFETLKQSMLNRIAEKATTTARGGGSRINPHSVAKQFLALNQDFVKREFGENAAKKANALALVYRDMPPELNPSGTGAWNEMANLIMSNIKTIPIAALNAGLRAPKGGAARAALFTAATAGIDQAGGANAAD